MYFANVNKVSIGKISHDRAVISCKARVRVRVRVSGITGTAFFHFKSGLSVI